MPWNCTCVYWDVGAWCPCDDTDPEIIFGRINSALYLEGFHSDLLIRAYVDPNQLSDELLLKYRESEFMVIREEDKSARFNTILLDIALWALNTREPSTFVVITRISQHTEYLIRVLLSLKQRGCEVFLAVPDASLPNDITNISVSQRGRNVYFLQLLPDRTELRVCICPDLFEKKPYFEDCAEYYEQGYINPPEQVSCEDVYWEDYEYPEEDNQEEEEEEEEEESFSHKEEESLSLGIPKSISFSMDSKSGDGKTGIFWDVTDYPLPADLDSSLFYDNIRSSLVAKGFMGEMFIWAYVPDDGSQLPPHYRDLDGRFKLVPHVPGDKYGRLNKMNIDLLLWALDNPVEHSHGPNVMVISKNLQGKTKFYQILQGFKCARDYSVCLALPGDEEGSQCIGASVIPWKSLLSRSEQRQ